MTVIETLAENTSRRRALAASFTKAASRYDTLACIQNDIAAVVKQKLVVKDGSSLLDIGCGTGLQTAGFTPAFPVVVGLDLAPGMVAFATKRYPDITFKEGDASALPFDSNTFSAVFSSMALQWCEQPSQVLNEIFRVLKPGGRASLGVMIAGSFSELAAARKSCNQPDTVNRFASSRVWKKAAADAKFDKVECAQRSYVDTFDNIRGLLKSITSIGAGVSFSEQASVSLTRRDLLTLETAYVRDKAQQLPLTYQVLHLLLEK